MANSKEHRAGEWTQLEPGDVDIPSKDWDSFLDSFSRQHQGWLVTISNVFHRQSTQAINCRLQRITVEPTDTNPQLRISLDCDDGNRIEFAYSPVRLIFKRDATGAHEGLDIVASDSSVTNFVLPRGGSPRDSRWNSHA
jgi:hypothetical protein